MIAVGILIIAIILVTIRIIVGTCCMFVNLGPSTVNNEIPNEPSAPDPNLPE